MEGEKVKMILSFISTEANNELHSIRVQELTSIDGVPGFLRDSFLIDSEVYENWTSSDFLNKNFLSKLPLLYLERHKQWVEDDREDQIEEKESKYANFFNDNEVDEEETILLNNIESIITKVVASKKCSKYLDSVFTAIKFNKCNFMYPKRRNKKSFPCNRDCVEEKCLLHSS